GARSGGTGGIQGRGTWRSPGAPAGERLRARLRGAGAPHAGRLLREERPLPRRRLPPGLKTRGRVLRGEAAEGPREEREARRGGDGARGGRLSRDQGPAGQGIPEPVPSRLRRRPDK